MKKIELILIMTIIFVITSCELSPFVREKEAINPEQT